MAECFDCKRPYGHEHGFPDLIIPFWAWKQISPTGNDGGLLCPSCICKRLHDAGIRCEGAFLSGPITSVSEHMMERNDERRAEHDREAIERPTRIACYARRALKGREAMTVSEAQRLLEQGKHLITPFEGYWYMILPPSSWVAELLGDNIFRTGFEAEVSEEEVRAFYVKRLNVRPDEIEKAV